MAERKLRILLGKVGLDGHDRGVRMLSTWLRNSGMEVIYIGTHNLPKAVVEIAIQEDVDVIGLSFQGGEHSVLVQAVFEEMKKAELGDAKLIAGGNIPRQDIDKLKSSGVDEIFPAGTPMAAITDYLNNLS
ncbi:MAG: cobalamin-dependent protein [Desulfatiglans sp.]|nr:cobalamin-dependent protein [Thermodesulfobacteriota bacterium]MEE4353159.1 cobalamin-dependent protein [Desulfatiglans sp.]